MKVILNHYHVQCATCGSGIQGQQAWIEAPNIIVECANPNCENYGHRYKLPITKLDLEPFEPEPDVGPSILGEIDAP